MKRAKWIQTGCFLLCTMMLSLHPAQAAAGRAVTAAVPATGSQPVQGQNEQTITYKIKTDKVEYKDDDGRVRGVVSFSYPQFDGTSDEVLKINRQIKKKSRKALASDSAVSLKEYTESSIANDRFHEDTEKYFWETYCDASYVKDGIVSFYMSEHWYAGGVHNRTDYGLNYNLNTGKQLTIKDVIAGNAKKALLKAAKKYCGSDTGAYETIKKTKKYKFYLENGDVHICFGSYELGHGISIDEFTVKGSY